MRVSHPGGGIRWGSSVSAAPSECDPFAPSPKPISLEKVVAAGRSAAGIAYVVDEVAHENRVFISNNGVLERQRSAGSMTDEGGDGLQFNVFRVEDHDPPFTLQIDLGPGGPASMEVLEGPQPDDSKTIPTGQGERLTLLSDEDVASMSVRNLPGAQVLEYNARTADGRALIVIRPRDDGTYQDFRVFFGEPAQPIERQVKSVSCGSYTFVLFDLEGADATALFKWDLLPDSPGPDEGSLTVGGAVLELTLLDTSAPPSGMSFLCLGR